jgi:D-threo-aldose 1-dehydrogenase
MSQDGSSLRLGFGCGQLLRIPRLSDQLRILDTAFDVGIRHYDVARMYGLGQAEGVLGRFARNGKREQITITTKFGIEPRQTTGRLAGIQQLGRTVVRHVPALRTLMRNRAGKLYEVGDFSVQAASRSLEKSLSELGTDYIDYFLLHDPSTDANIEDDLLEWLERARLQGKIGDYGVAGAWADVCHIIQARPALRKVLQFPNDVVNRNIEKVEFQSIERAFTFSPFSASLEYLRKRFEQSPDDAQRAREIAGLDPANADMLSEILLAYAVNSNPNSVVVFSTSRAQRLTSLVASTFNRHVSFEHLRNFMQIVDRLLGR